MLYILIMTFPIGNLFVFLRIIDLIAQQVTCMYCTFSSVTWEVMCHIRFSPRNFRPYGPSSSARARSSVQRVR